MRVLVIDELHEVLINKLSESGIQCDYEPDIDPQAVSQRIATYEGLILRGKIKVDRDLIDQAPKLQFIGRAGAGMENIDLQYAEAKNITCINAPEGNSNAVAEHALGMIISLFRKITKVDQEVRSGIWERESNRGIELSGKTIGILGFGNMGSAFANILKGFNVNVIAYDKYLTDYGNDWVTECTETDFFNAVDVLSIHVPLTTETQAMINHAYLNRFSKSIYVVNTARGKIVNTKDLVENLKASKVLGACLDVLEYEGFTFNGLSSADLPEAFSYLTKSEQVILTPHIAGVTHESKRLIAEVLAGKIIQQFKPAIPLK